MDSSESAAESDVLLGGDAAELVGINERRLVVFPELCALILVAAFTRLRVDGRPWVSASSNEAYLRSRLGLFFALSQAFSWDFFALEDLVPRTPNHRFLASSNTFNIFFSPSWLFGVPMVER